MLSLTISNQLREDFAPFADAGLTLDGTTLSWAQRGKPRQVTIEPAEEADDLPSIIEDGITWDYRAFFASAAMADLRWLAERTRNDVVPVSGYIEPKARVVENDESTTAAAGGSPASTLLAELCFEQDATATRLVFVRGQAGAGKTELLRRVTQQRADAYLKGSVTSLFLYVDAQGRALSRLDDALAATKDDLRAAFNYHAIPVLVRLGLLVPIIDGFDELLGAAGYQEAFASLALFVKRLGGTGVLVASARDNFYRFSDFARAAERLNSAAAGTVDYSLTSISVLPWGVDELKSYLEATGIPPILDASTSDGGAAELRARLGANAEVVTSNPFFVARVMDLLRAGVDLPSTDELVPAVVDQFIAREIEKSVGPGNVPLLTGEQHKDMLAALAEEMFMEDSLSLRLDTVTTVAEVEICDRLQLSPGSAKSIVAKFPHHGVLHAIEDHSGPKVAFRHEFYFAFFLARRITAAILGDEKLANFWGRSSLSPVVAREIVSAVRRSNLPAEKFLRSLGHQHTGLLSAETAKRNIGRLYEAFCGLDITFTNMKFAGAVFDGAAFGLARLRDSCFEGCIFSSCDLTQAKWANVVFLGCWLQEPLIDLDVTRMQGCRLADASSITGIRVRDANGQRSAFAPEEVADVLTRIGLSAESTTQESTTELRPPSKRHIAVLERLLRVTDQTYYLSGDDLANKGIDKVEEWPSLLRVLKSSGVISETRIARRGTSGNVMHLAVGSEELRRGENGLSSDPRIIKFWTELRDL